MKACIVTGAGSGIGKSIATTLSGQGWYLILIGRDLAKLEATQSEIQGPSQCFSVDLANAEAIISLTKEIQNIVKSHPLRCLINNAAIFTRAPFRNTEVSLWEQMFQINLLGVVRMIHEMLPFLEQAAPSSIINISSTLGIRPVAETSAYSSSKAALNSLTECLSLELADKNIRVNGICPGLVDTPIHDFHGLPKNNDIWKELDQAQPLGRIGQPKDIASAVAFLASDEASWITGVNLPVSGGIHLV